MMDKMGARARAAARSLAITPAETKTRALLAMSQALRAGSDDIVAANGRDMEAGREAGLSDAMLDRLKLTPQRIEAIAGSVDAIAALEDPVGAVIAAWDRPNGLKIERVRTPLGVIGVIYESRPNVTADAGALCLKAGNAVILRGGSDSRPFLGGNPCLPGRGAGTGRASRRGDPVCAHHRPRRRGRDAEGPRR